MIVKLSKRLLSLNRKQFSSTIFLKKGPSQMFGGALNTNLLTLNELLKNLLKQAICNFDEKVETSVSF